MDSQDVRNFSQDNTDDIDNGLSGNPRNYQERFISSQLHAQNATSHPNPFLQPDQISNQFTPLNLPFARTYAVNPMCGPFPTPLQHQGAPGFSFQGLMNEANIRETINPTTDQTSKPSKKPPKKSKVSKNVQTTQSIILRRWSTKEDIALTKAWLYISVDADVGTNQKSGSLWNRILQVWRNNMGEYDPIRNSNALGCRWGTIQNSVNKFHGCYEQLERNTPPSGTNPDDMMREALRMYSDFNEGSFKFEHCWQIMKNNPKWCTQQLTKQGASKKQKSVENDFVDSSVVDEATDPCRLTTESTNSDGVSRPEGRKATKEKKKKANSEKGVIDVLGHLQCTLEKQFDFNREELELKKERYRKEYELREQTMKEELELKKARDKKELELKERNQKLKEKAQKRKDQERILNKDLSNMEPTLRKGFEAIQSKILKEWESDALFGENSE